MEGRSSFDSHTKEDVSEVFRDLPEDIFKKETLKQFIFDDNVCSGLHSIALD